VALVSPLVEGTDGQAKMSKSLGNSIGLSDAPKDVFGLAMRIADPLLPKFLRLLTDLPDATIEALLAPGTHPRDAKLAMAEALVARYHGVAVGAAARAEFVHVISEGAAPSEVTVKKVPPGPLPAWDLLRMTGLAASGTQARQLLREGAVTGHVAGATRVGEGYSLPPGAYRMGEKTFWPSASGDLVQVGSRRWVKLEVDAALPPYASPAGAPPLSPPVPKDAK